MRNRHEIIYDLVRNYMDDITEHPEVVRDALYCYFEGFDNETLLNTLKGFGD